MNFDLTTTEWTEIENLTNDKTYFLQAKSINEDFESPIYRKQKVLYSIGDKPTDIKTGLLISEKVFKKTEGMNIYIKALATPINIEIQEQEVNEVQNLIDGGII